MKKLRLRKVGYLVLGYRDKVKSLPHAFYNCMCRSQILVCFPSGPLSVVVRVQGPHSPPLSGWEDTGARFGVERRMSAAPRTACGQVFTPFPPVSLWVCREDKALVEDCHWIFTD